MDDRLGDAALPQATGSAKAERPWHWVAQEAPVIDARQGDARVVHGVALDDGYAWLRTDNWRDVLRDPTQLPDEVRRVLDAENAYVGHCLAPLEGLIATLKSEMRARIKEDDATVPTRDGSWDYYRRFRDGGQHPLICRRAGEGEEQVLLDGDEEARGHAFFSLGDVAHSRDHGMIAWSSDAKGSELHTVRVRTIGGADLDDRVERTDGSIVWMNDGSGFYYVLVDDNHRTCSVHRHRIGSTSDERVFAENDPAWFVGLQDTASGRFAIIRVSDHAATECHLLDLEDPNAEPKLVEPRSAGHRYSVEHHPSSAQGDILLIRTNLDDAIDFKLVVASLATPSRAHWQDVVSHRAGRMIVSFSVYPDHLVRLEREDGLPRIVIRDLASGEERSVDFPEEAYGLSLHSRLMFADEVVRFTYESMTTPREVYDLDLRGGERRLRKRQIIPSGHEPARYVTRRLQAVAEDGVLVPVTVLHRRDLALDGTSPLLLYGYGAYGHAIPASFSANALSLVDRGFVYAIAHVRGGSDKGWRWYLDGKLAAKENTFRDFVAAAEHLVAERFTAAGRIVAQGGSAGGMLMGAVANLAPHLFAGIVANVPFVDVLNTMLDDELPLTPPEWLEWGNPIEDAQAFARIRAYSPYDNVRAQAYPPILATAGLTDPRVTYWEPAKWVARLRAIGAARGPILLKTNMGAGHGGASGRFDRLGEVAESFAFALACAYGLTIR